MDYRFKQRFFIPPKRRMVRPKLFDNEGLKRYELRFPVRPGPALLQILHITQSLPRGQQWHWDRPEGVWYAQKNEATLKLGEALLAHSCLPILDPGESIEFPKSVWSDDFAMGHTRLSYEMWVEEKINSRTEEEIIPAES